MDAPLINCGYGMVVWLICTYLCVVNYIEDSYYLKIIIQSRLIVQSEHAENV